jgi:hypothetical protein
MAKVLLVDTNFSSGPIYEELVVMGHETHVVGANPGDCLAKASPNYWHLDYSDTGALAALVEQQGYEYLVPGCTDRSYESCVAINGGSFPGFDDSRAAAAIGNKGEFRRLAERIGLPVPKTRSPHSDTWHGPVVVKPVDAFSGKGISILRDKDAASLAAAIAAAREVSPSGEFLVEDFVEGQLYSYSAFLADMRVVREFLVQEDGTVNPFVVDTSRVVARATPELLTRLRDSVEKLAAELRLVDGLLHTQFISNGNDFWLIEMTRRCPGDLYSQLIELSTEHAYARSYVLPFLGQSFTPDVQSNDCHPIMRHTLTLQSEQNLAFVHFKRLVSIERWVPLSLVGDQLKPSPRSRVAVLFCRASDEHDLELLYQTTLRRNLYEIRSSNRMSPAAV